MARCVQCGKPLVSAESGLACVDCAVADVAASRTWAERVGPAAPALGAAVVARSCSFEIRWNGWSLDVVALVVAPVALILAGVAAVAAVRGPPSERPLRAALAAVAAAIALWALVTAVG